MINGLANSDVCQQGIFVAGSILGNQEADGPADDLLVRVAVHSFGRGVPAGDDALERGGNDGIVRVLNDGRGELGVLDRPPLLGHVLHRRDHQQDVTGVDVRQTDIDRELASIPTTSAQLQIESTGASPGVCEVLISVFGVDLPEGLRHQRLDRLADEFVAVVAEQRFALAIDKPDYALLVHPHQGVRHCL